jgi:hypothetical protein
MHANKIATSISSKLIQKNTYKQYVSAKEEELYAIIENNNDFVLFFSHIYRYLYEVDPLISPQYIKQLSESLKKIIVNVIKYNLAQVLPQFQVHIRPCKYCHSSEYFDNQCTNKVPHQQQIDKYTYYPRHIK